MNPKCILIGAVLVGLGFYAYKKGVFSKAIAALKGAMPGGG